MVARPKCLCFIYSVPFVSLSYACSTVSYAHMSMYRKHDFSSDMYVCTVVRIYDAATSIVSLHI